MKVVFGLFEKYEKLFILCGIGKNVHALETHCLELIDFTRFNADVRANCDETL